MISYIYGEVKAVAEQSVVIDINGIGMCVAVAQEAAYTVGKQATVHIYMHWNQEQGPSLYGFINELERAVFMMVIDCSGIGPKIGLAVLHSLGAERFIEILQSSDERALSKVNGIGPKKAEQMIVQLKHKVNKLLEKGFIASGKTHVSHWQNIQEVLESLNYSRMEITVAMRHLRDSNADESLAFDVLMRRALSYMAKNK